jgi:zinc transport system ATP-binding protein
VVEIENASFSYDSFPILENVNVAIRERDFVSIVGPNGGGKTTLLKLILGLLVPSVGRVLVFGSTPQAARPRIGYMPQSARLDPQFPATVMDVVLMGRLGMGNRFGPYASADKSAASQALEEVGLAHVRSTAFSSLSGGQRQRLLIARALTCEPELLLLDEPTSNLDLAIESELYELLTRLNRRMTILLVSHDLGFVSQYVKHVICVKRRVRMHPTCDITGEVISEIYGAPMKMVLHDHNHSKVFHPCTGS